MSDLSLLDQDNDDSSGTGEFWNTNSFDFYTLFEVTKRLSDDDRINCAEALEILMEIYVPGGDISFSELYLRYCVISAVELDKLEKDEYQQFGAGQTYDEYVQEREMAEEKHRDRLEALRAKGLASKEQVAELLRYGDASYPVDYIQGQKNSPIRIVYNLWYLYGTLTRGYYVQRLCEGLQGLYCLAMTELSIVARDLELEPNNEYFRYLHGQCVKRVRYIIYDMSLEDRVVKSK